LFSDVWEMGYGEQAALEGVLSLTNPQLSLEIGTYRGGSLNRIAAHSNEVHTFDLATHVDTRLPHVRYHIGDSAATVPALLDELEQAGRNVDFALVDGDHERAGVCRDLRTLLDSPAIARTVILLHDTANEDVRAGIRDASLQRRGIAYANLSFVPPAQKASLTRELWGGLGIIVVDNDGDLWHPRRRIDENVEWLTAVPQSLAWQAMAPARAAKRRVMYRLRPTYRRMRGSRGVRLRRESSAAGDASGER
jgi:hypothetical protein